MAYKVINAFKDTKDEKREYAKGEVYPKTFYKPEEERLSFLESKGFIEEVPEESKNEDFPIHKGGGNYVLSNGESVRGKEAAFEAEEQLKAGE